jgi:toxin ParE1/3/4
MARAELTPAANRDVIAIALAISADRPRIAARVLGRLNHLFGLLAKHPRMGERYQTPRHREARRFPADAYVIYYVPMEYGILIIRILHGARDHSDLI